MATGIFDKIRSIVHNTADLSLEGGDDMADKSKAGGSWQKPMIRPLMRLGAQIHPTSISASSSEMYAQSIDELRVVMSGKK